MAALYTRAANRRRLAIEAMQKLAGPERPENSYSRTLQSGTGGDGKNERSINLQDNKMARLFEQSSNHFLETGRPFPSEMARPDGATSNKLLETLTDWNTYLEQGQPSIASGKSAANLEPRP